MAFKDMPGFMWGLICLLALLMGWQTFRFYTGVPPFPDEIRNGIGKLFGFETSKEQPADGKEVQGQ